MKRDMSEMRQQLNGLLAGQTTPANPPINQDDYQTVEEIHEETTNIEELEKESIRRALERCAGNRKAAAEALGISERTLYRKIKEYDIL